MYQVSYQGILQRRHKEFETESQAKAWAVQAGVYEYSVIRKFDIDQIESLIKQHFDPYQFDSGCEFDVKLG